jgi:redox-sensing transcriptional repressor
MVKVVSGENSVIGLITTPPQVAQEVADRLVEAGVTSILNFAPIVLTVPTHVSLRKVDLSIELQILSFYQQRAGAGPIAAEG